MDKTKKAKFKKVVEQLKKQNTSNTLKEMVELVEKNTEQQDESIEQLQRGQEYLESAQVQEMPGNVLTPPGQLESVESVEEPKAVENSRSIAELQAELDRVNALIAGFEKKKPKGKKTATKVKQSQAKQVLSGETPDLTSPNNALSVPKEETAEPVAAEKKTRGPKGSEKLISTLNRIYTFMQKNREMDVTEREKELSKAEDIKQLKEQRHKELIDALKGISGSGVGTETAKKEKPGEDSGGGIMGLLASFGLKKLGSKLAGGAKGAAGAVEGAGGAAKGAAGAAEGLAEGAAKSATKVSKILNGAKGVLKFLQKIPGLSVIAAGATLLFDIKNAIDAHESGKLDDNGLKKQITKSLGGALGGLGGAEIGGLLGGALGSVIPGAGTLVGGILGGAAGFFGGEKLGEMAAEKAFDFFSGGQDKDPPSDPLKEADKIKKKEGGATPAAAGAAPSAPSGGAMPAASASATPSAGGGASTPAASAAAPSGGGSAPPAMPTASPVGGGGAAPGTPAAPAAGGAPATPPAAPAAAPTAMPAAPPPAPSSALAPMIEKNQDMKLDAASSGGGTTVNNNTESKSGSTGPDKTKGPMPSIRNKDSTFERLVYYSTRVV
jgi:hypothetical protein